nr:uncharacterized protein LOC113729653 [Coffea arabica]
MKMSLVTQEIRASASEIYNEKELCQVKAKVFLKEVGLPDCLLPLEDIEECGFVKETGFIWLKRKQKIVRKFEKIDKLAQYAAEITAYAEPKKLKSVTGLKAKELFLWVTVSDVEVEDAPTGKISFKSPLGLTRTFPRSAFEVAEAEEVKTTKNDRTDNEVKSRV